MALTLIPYLRVPCFVDRGQVRFSHSTQDDTTEAERALIKAVFQGGRTLAELAQEWVDRGLSDDPIETAARFRRAFENPRNVIGLAEVELPESTDVVLVEQGYGGVYVHSVELHKKLQEHWNCLLLSPVKPLFEPEPLAGVVTLEDLKETQPELGYFAWIQIVRTIVQRTRCKLLMLMHRSQALYLFDLLGAHNSVIYCDGFYDGAFRRVQDFHLDESDENKQKVLAEVFYLASNAAHSFYGICSTPSLNAKLLMAGGFSLLAAKENWCWGNEQRRHFADAYPDRAETIRLMLPFTDDRLFRPKEVQREKRVLFTTTMHNIKAKGFPELVRAMGRLRSVQTRCVVRQPERLPSIPKGVASRMEMGAVTKSEMVNLYHRMWVNCRTSREESSPMSILESMTCELPQIVSPAVANQIPIIEDGATGFVVDPDDGERLAWALKTILSDRTLRDRMGRECRRRASALSFDRRIGDFQRLMA